MFRILAEFLLRTRWPVIIALAVVTVAAAWQAKDVRFDFSPRSIFLTADEEVQFLAEHRSRFGDEDAMVMVLLEAPDIFDRGVLERVQSLSDQLGALEHVDRVYSLATMQQVRGQPGWIEVLPLLDELPNTAEEAAALKERTTTNRLYRNRFVNPSGTATAILAKFDDGFVDEVKRRPVLAKMKEILVAHDDSALEMQLVGLPVINREYALLLQGDMSRTLAISVVLMVIVLGTLFRSATSVILPLVAVFLAVTWTVAYMVLAEDYFNIINAIVPTLLLVIGVGDAVHFLTTYYQELGAGETKDSAISRMVVRIGGACFLTTLTAAVGFASLMVARIDIIRGMGRVAAVGLVLAYVVILALVPAVLSLTKEPVSGVRVDPKEGAIGSLLAWLGKVTTEKRLLVVAVTGALCLACIAGSFRVRTDSFLLEELFPHHPISKGLHHTEDVLTGVMPAEVAIRTSKEGGVLEPEVLRAIEALQEHMEADPFVGHTASVVDLVKEIAFVMTGERLIPETREEVTQYLLLFQMSEDPSFLDSLLGVNRQNARISATLKDWGTSNFFSWYDGSGDCDPRAQCGTPVVPLIDEVFGTEAGRSEGIEVRVTGGSLIAARALSRLVEDMLASLTTAFFIISLLMMVLLRSFRIGLLAMIPNLIPLLVTLGFMGWFGIPLRTSTALIFSVALGVAVNDTIHFLTRYREELIRTKDRVGSVKLTILSTGRAIIFTSVLLVFGFATMMTSRFVGIFQMGVLGAVTLFAALLGDLLLLPVALVLFKPWSRFVERAPKAGGGEVG